MMKTMAQNSFDSQVASWIHGVYRHAPMDFADLLRHLPGVYPTDVMSALQRIERESAIPDLVQWAANRMSEATLPGPPISDEEYSWLTPIPHPLDYDWRFTPDCAYELADVVAKSALDAGTPGSVILLGAPSVYRALCTRWPECPAVLLDRVQSNLSRAPASLCVDIARGDLTDLQPARVVLADPPWYPEHFKSFLWTAAKLATPNARVFCSIPGPGTRPHIEAEWEDIVRWATTAGLTLAGVKNDATEYLTSPFEANALRAAGILNIPWRWRRAALAEFRRLGPLSATRPPAPNEDEWREVQTGIVRWKLRHTVSAGKASPKILQIVPGDILTTVSRRSPLRGRAVVWTSGNRIFGCENPDLLGSILEALGEEPYEHPQPPQIIRRAFGRLVGAKTHTDAEATARRALQIFELETAEYGRP